MKKLIVLLLTIPCVILLSTSCKDDAKSANPADLIIGSWQMVSFVASECADPADNETETCSTGCEITIFTKDTVTFEGEPSEPYSIDGNKITFGTGSGADTYEFSVTETTLIVTNTAGDCKEVTTLKKV